MSSNRTLKTHTKAEFLLLSQIEKFAVENDFNIDRLYDIDVAEEIFGPELIELRNRLEECNKMMAWMQKQKSGKWVSYFESMLMAGFPIINAQGTIDVGFEMMFDGIDEMSRTLKRKRRSYERQIWEIHTYIKACRRCRDLSKSYASISQTMTQHMWESVTRGAHPA